MRIAVIGVPYNSSGTIDGVARAPAALRAAGLIAALGARCDLRDLGDVPLDTPTTMRDATSGIIDPRSLTRMIEGVRELVRQALLDGCLPLVVGGDCPILLGCLAAAREVYGPVGLLFIDGHEDAWPPLLSTTGEAADMELGLALGVTGVAGIPALAARLPLIEPSDVFLLGPRDAVEIGAGGVQTLAGSVPFLSDTEVRGAEIAVVARMVAMRVQARTGHWWLHVDLDVLSTDALPAIDYPQEGGWSWDHLAVATSAALSTSSPVGWNITIYNPDLDPGRLHAARIVAYLAQAVAQLK